MFNYIKFYERHGSSETKGTRLRRNNRDRSSNDREEETREKVCHRWRRSENVCRSENFEVINFSRGRSMLRVRLCAKVEIYASVVYDRPVIRDLRTHDK